MKRDETSRRVRPAYQVGLVVTGEESADERSPVGSDYAYFFYVSGLVNMKDRLDLGPSVQSALTLQVIVERHIDDSFRFGDFNVEQCKNQWMGGRRAELRRTRRTGTRLH